jgi:PAS domain S-box-containing protein
MSQKTMLADAMETPARLIKPSIIAFMLMVGVFGFDQIFGAHVGCLPYVLILFVFLRTTKNQLTSLVLGVIATVFAIATLAVAVQGAGVLTSTLVDGVLSVPLIWIMVVWVRKMNHLNRQAHVRTEQLIALFENSNEGIVMADRAGRIILANAFIERMFHYKQGELLHKEITSLFSERSLSEGGICFQSKLGESQECNSRVEMTAVDRNGNEFPVEVNISPCCKHRPETIIAFVVDLSERKKHQRLMEKNLGTIQTHNLELEATVVRRTRELEVANAQLRKSQHFYKLMAKNFPDGVIGILDEDMRFILVDGQDLDQLGLHESAAIGDASIDSTNSAVASVNPGLLQEVYQGKSIYVDIVFRGRDYALSAVPIDSHGPEIKEILVVIKDISRRKRLEKDLIKTLEKEKELNILKSRFVTMASHEFRTPLTTILSSAFLLENYTREQFDREKQKHFDRIKRAVHGLTEILNDFLSLGKLEEGRIHVSYTEVEFYGYIEGIVQEMISLKKADQTIEFYRENESAHGVVDRQLTKNVIVNLLSNAIKYSPRQGLISVRCKNANGYLCVEIVDNGMGIPKEEQKHIFKRFFRANNVTGIEGTGLGLNLVRKYVKLLNGRIEFESEPGIGTTFRIYFPINPNHPELQNYGNNYELQHLIN